MNGDGGSFLLKIIAAVIGTLALPLTWLWSVAAGSRRDAAEAQRRATRAETRVGEIKDIVERLERNQELRFQTFGELIQTYHSELTTRIDCMVNGTKRGR